MIQLLQETVQEFTEGMFMQNYCWCFICSTFEVICWLISPESLLMKVVNLYNNQYFLFGFVWKPKHSKLIIRHSQLEYTQVCLCLSSVSVVMWNSFICTHNNSNCLNKSYHRSKFFSCTTRIRHFMKLLQNISVTEVGRAPEFRDFLLFRKHCIEQNCTCQFHIPLDSFTAITVIIQERKS